MIYVYACPDGHLWEVVKSVAEIDHPEMCTRCAGWGARQITRTHFYGARVEEAEYSPAFGCVTYGKRHRNELAKRKGMIEIGNEPTESIHRTSEGTLKKKIDDIWSRREKFELA